MKHLTPRKLTITLALTAALLMGMLTPALAGAQPVITVVGVVPGGLVQLRIDNLPANTTFAVWMGPAGSGGKGGLVANFDTGLGGTGFYWFEIQATVRTAASVDVRVDNGAGIAAVTTFVNGVLPAPSTPPTTTPAPVIPPTGGGAAAIHLLSVQKGGWVHVELLNFPNNEEFTVTVGALGTKGIGGTIVAHVQTGTEVASGAYFEIPVVLRNEAKLDLRLDSGSHAYVLTFENKD